MATTPSKSPLSANNFHKFTFDAAKVKQWKTELKDLEVLISPTKAPKGLGEAALLKWFGASVDRIALLAYAVHGIVPTHVARELEIGSFRADFAWADVDHDVDPTVGLIELENCELSTLFEKKQRKAPYLGSRFLGGFGQLVDWCSFGQGQAKTDATISAVLGSKYANTSYVFALVAGDTRFSGDALSKTRLQWWRDNVKIGHGTSSTTFDQVLKSGQQRVKILEKAK